MITPEWLKATPKDQLPQPERLAFPPPPRGEGIHRILFNTFSIFIAFLNQTQCSL
jgi:hypothetical protein